MHGVPCIGTRVQKLTPLSCDIKKRLLSQDAAITRLTSSLNHMIDQRFTISEAKSELRFKEVLAAITGQRSQPVIIDSVVASAPAEVVPTQPSRKSTGAVAPKSVQAAAASSTTNDSPVSSRIRDRFAITAATAASKLSTGGSVSPTKVQSNKNNKGGNSRS